MLVRHVTDPDRREVRLTGERTQAGELGHRHRDLVVAVGMRVRHRFERPRGLRGHGRLYRQRAVRPMPTATATQARRRSLVRRSPATSAAITTPKIGWVRKKPARL